MIRPTLTRPPAAFKLTRAGRARRRTALWAAAGALAAAGLVAAQPAAGADRAAARPAGQALAAIRDRQFPRARQAIRRIRNPFARAAVLFALYRRAGSGAPAGEMLDFVERRADWPVPPVLRQRIEEADPGDLAGRRLIAWFARFPPVTGPGCTRLADALDRRGDRAGANRAIARCWKTAAMTSAAETRFFRRYGRRLSAADRAVRVRRHLAASRYRGAARLLARLKLPARLAAPLKVRIDLQRRPTTRTVRRVRKAIRRLPAGARKDADFVFDLARWYRRRGKVAAAAAALAAAPKRLDAAARRRWWRERSLLVRELLDRRHHTRAWTVAADHRQTSGHRLAGAENLAGWIALRKRRRIGQAMGHFRKAYLASERRNVQAMAAWWQGEAWRARQRPDEAAAWHRSAAAMPFGYFGQLALMRLGTPGLALPPDTAVAPEAKAAFEREPAVRLTRFYAGKGARAESRRLLWWLIGRTVRPSGTDGGAGADAPSAGRRLLLLAMLADGLGERHIAVRAARLALSLGFVRVGLAYPVPALPPALPVEPALILAIARQESEFNVAARSRANARGLMQLLPATAKFAARKARIRWDPRRLSRDAAYNTRLGAAYLAWLLGRFEGSYPLTAAAYNAGPTRVARWIERYGRPGTDIDPVDWIEAIPYGETRNFVRRVLANVAVYRVRLGGRGLAETPVAAWRPRR